MSSADIEAINDYFSRTTATTSEARADQASWTAWYKNLSFFDKMTDGTLQDASAKRDRFNIDNKTPPIPSVPLTAEEANYFLKMPIVNTTGMTADEAQKAVWSAKSTVTQPVSLTVNRSTIKQGSKGDNVKEWQRIVGGIAVDGIFGAGTTTATKNWQKAHGLTADGIVGPKTWGIAYGDLPTLNPEKPAVSTSASARSAEGPAEVGKTYSVPTAKPATVAAKTATKTTVTAKPKTATVTAKPSTVAPSAITTTPKLVQANMLSALTNLPTWTKWVAGVLAVIGFGYGIKYHTDHQKKVT